MKKNSKRPLIVILLILVVPVVIYGVFELNSLTTDERELERIYERQLEAVLFSINQSLQDKFTELTSTLNIEGDNWSDQQRLDYLAENRYFRALYINGPGEGNERVLSDDPGFREWGFLDKAQQLYAQKNDIINRLIRYKQADFLKVEQGTEEVEWNKEWLDYVVFVLGEKDQPEVYIFYFNGVEVIEQFLVPKLQEIAREDFILTTSRIEDGFQIYSTSDQEVANIKSQPLDLLPKYEVAIARVGGTVEDVVNQRKVQNLIALALLMVVMFIGIFLVFRNIQREMELAQKKADFVSNVSHEIRTPLALINMFAETLLMGRVKEESKKKEYYEIITKEVGRLSNMINRILSFSKIEANKRVYHKVALDLNAVVGEVHNTYSYHLENNGFEHGLQLSDNGLYINADREAIIEVLVNLIDNGMKYSADNKKVVIATGIEGDMAFVSVQDHGMGIPKNQVEKLFEKFYRVPTGDVHDTKGSGLGLTLVKHIMDAHQGDIKVVSEVGVGSKFKLFFPLDQQANA